MGDITSSQNKIEKILKSEIVLITEEIKVNQQSLETSVYKIEYAIIDNSNNLKRNFESLESEISNSIFHLSEISVNEIKKETNNDFTLIKNEIVPLFKS